MAYVYDVNTNLGANGIYTAWYELKELLKTAGWTTQSSSDGITYFPASDGITGSGAGAGGMRNASSWFRMQDPSGAGGREFLFQTASWDGVQSGMMWYSKDDGFTGGAPGITTSPTAADEQIVAGGVGHDGSTAVTIMSGGANPRFHAVAENAAINGVYPWVGGGYESGGGSTSYNCFFCDAIVSGTGPPAGTDNDPCVMMASQGGGATWFIADLCSRASWVQVNGYTRFGEVDEVFGTIPALYYRDATGIIVPDGIGQNPYDSNNHWDFPLIYARGSWGATATGWKGMSHLFRWKGQGHNTGDTLNLTAADARIVIGDVTMPWEQNTAPLV